MGVIQIAKVGSIRAAQCLGVVGGGVGVGESVKTNTQLA